MTTPDPIVLDVDATGYISNLGKAEQATSGFVSTLRGIPVATGPMQRAMDQVTPPRAALMGMGALAVAAGNTQQQLALVQAQARLTGANFGTMSQGMRSLARDLPITNRGAREMYGTLSRLGVVGKETEKPLNAVDKTLGKMNKTFVDLVPGMQRFEKGAKGLFGSQGSLFGGTGAEKRVNELARGFEKLGAATGENASAMATGMTRLNQAMGTGMDPKRVMALSDSVTTLSATTGASAAGILELSKSIAPFTRAAGIGQTTTMGISAAFNKMGEDGFGAANAVGKILSDMSRATREGTPQMAAYAQMVGKTTEQFQALFEMNPAEALTQVTEALGRDPANAPRMLESVGLDGVRTQRYLQQLSQSGGLRSAISDATAGYGSGSTALAAEEAMDGLFDSSQRAAAASEQLATSLGTPLLGPLTLVTDMLGGLASAGEKVLGSGIAQGVLSGGVWTGLAGLAAYKMMKAGGTVSLAGQALTSGPVRGFAAGLREGRFGENAAQGAGRIAGPFMERYAEGGRDALGRTEMSRSMNMAGLNAGRAVGGFMGPGGGGPSLLRQGVGFATMGAGVLMRLQADQFRMARTPFDQRQGLMRPYGAEFDRFAEARTEAQAAVKAGTMTAGEGREAQRRAFRELTTEVNGAAGGVKGFARQMTAGTAAIAYQGTRTAVAAGGAGLARAGRGAMGLLGGPAGVALAGGLVGYQAFQGMQQREKEDQDRRENSSGFLDDYKVAMGKATDATETFSGRLNTAAESLAKSTTSMSEAFAITSKDVEAAAGITAPARTFGSRTGAGAGALLASESATKPFSADELTRISYDLINQYGAGGAAEAMDQLRGGGGSSALLKPVDLSGAVNSLVNAEDRGDLGTRLKRRFDLNRLPEWMQRSGTATDARGTALYTNTLSDETRADTDSLAVGVSTRRSERAEMYGDRFASDTARVEMDQAIKTAMDRGDNAQVQELAKAFQQQNQVETRNVGFGDIEDAGGFSAFMAKQEKTWAERYGTGTGGVTATPEIQAGWVADRLKGIALQSWFSNACGGAAASAVRGVLDEPESPRVQQEALATLMEEARKGGMSLTQLSTEAIKAAAAHGNSADAAHQLMMAMMGAAAQMAQIQAPFGTPAEAAQGRAGRAAGIAAVDSNDPETMAAKRQALGELQQLEEQAVETVRARLTQQRETQVQMGRMEEDFRLQQAYAEDDYLRSRERANADYNTSRARAQQQFGRQEARATDDFYRQRRYALADFAKQMKRMAQDAARDMYDPFQRIQVQPTWDTRNLLGNLGEQLDAMNAQIDNLAKVRSGGLSDAVITMLGLNDPKNAQQLAGMVDELLNDPSLVGRLNANASAKTEAAGKLLADPANTAVARQSEDFLVQLDRQDEEFARVMERGREDFGITMRQMSEDHTKMLTRGATDRQISIDRTTEGYRKATVRMREDIKRADEIIVGDLSALTEMMNATMAGQFVDFEGKTKSGMAGWVTLLNQYKDQFHEILLKMGTDLTVKITAGAAAETNAQRDEQAQARAQRDTGGTGGGSLGVMSGRVSSEYGMRNGRMHSGIDIAAPIGTDVLAYKGGTVTRAGVASGYGNVIDINHGDGRVTRYAHLNSFAVKAGDTVRQGEFIADSGNTGRSTGPHLHFEMRVGGTAVNPRLRPFKDGGRVLGAGGPKDDANETRVSNGEYVLQASAAQAIGYDTLDQLNSLVSKQQLQGMQSAGGVVYVTYDSSTHIEDRSTTATGPITVVADDADAFLRSLEAKQARANLTAPPQRRTS